jgi:hypothetical protein
MKLTQPIEAHGEQINELIFRKPNAGDITAAGFPFQFTINEDGTQTIKPEAASITAMIARLGNIPPSSAKSMSFPDWMTAMGEMLGFFGQSTPPVLSNGASTLRGSGSGTPEKH